VPDTHGGNARAGDPIGLTEFIDRLKRELMQEPADASSPKLLMVEEVTLEIQCVASRAANAGINVYVVQVGGTAKRDDTHIVRVKLQPPLSHDERVQQLQRDPRWSDYVAAAVEYTVKGIDGDDSQLGQ